MIAPIRASDTMLTVVTNDHGRDIDGNRGGCGDGSDGRVNGGVSGEIMKARFFEE